MFCYDGVNYVWTPNRIHFPKSSTALQAALRALGGVAACAPGMFALRLWPAGAAEVLRGCVHHADVQVRGVGTPPRLLRRL